MTDDPRAVLVDMLAPVLEWLAQELADPTPGILSSSASAHALGERLAKHWPLAAPLVQSIEAAQQR